jgi:hypothetical protein
MLTKDVRFEGWTTEDWGRFLSLWKSSPDNGAATEADRRDKQSASGGLLVIHAGGRVRKMLHTNRGRIDKDSQTWPVPLAELAMKHAARWVLAAPSGGLEKIAERFGARSKREDDLSGQARLLLEIVRELVGAGIIEIWPNRIDRLSLPTHPLLENTFEAIYPPGQVIFVALFDQGELFTSIALERQKGGISRIIGPDDLRPRLSYLSGDFRRDYRYALAAAEDVIGPVAFGCFSELGIFRGLQNERSWGAWLKALAVRDVIITPTKSSLVAPIAADAAVWAAAAANSLGKRWDSLGLVLSLWRKWR